MYVQPHSLPETGVLVDAAGSQGGQGLGCLGWNSWLFLLLGNSISFIFITLKCKIFELKFEQLLHFLPECLNSTGKLIGKYENV